MGQRLPHRVTAPFYVWAVGVKEVWQFNMLLEWECPQDDSSSRGTHYTIQKVMGKPPPTAPQLPPLRTPNDTWVFSWL